MLINHGGRSAHTLSSLGAPPLTEVIFVIIIESPDREPQGLENVSINTFTIYHVSRLSKDSGREQSTATIYY